MADVKSLHQGINVADYFARIRFFLRFTPWQWLLACTFLLLSVSVYFVSILPKFEQIELASQHIERLRKNSPKHQTEWLANSPQTSLNAFYQSLPSDSSQQQILMQIYAAAQEHEVETQSATYHLQHNHQASFSEYQITLPVNGRYIQIRKFINQLLNTLPALALTGLNFDRENSASDNVNARIVLTVYLKSRS